jgi:hypothetical protein
MIDVSTLAFALNANSQVMSSNTHPRGSYSVDVQRIYGFNRSNNYISIMFEGQGSLGNSEIAVIPSGNFDIGGDTHMSIGPYSLKNPQPETSNGDILFNVVMPNEHDTFTIFIDCKKDNNDYDAGQTADPVAFNRGPGAPW